VKATDKKPREVPLTPEELALVALVAESESTRPPGFPGDAASPTALRAWLALYQAKLRLRKVRLRVGHRRGFPSSCSPSSCRWELRTDDDDEVLAGGLTCCAYHAEKGLGPGWVAGTQPPGDA